MKFENIVKSISSTLAAIMVYLIAAGMYLSFKGFVFENGEITLATPAQAQEIVQQGKELPADMALPENHIMGQKNAPITIYEYSSFGCFHCADFHLQTLPELKKKYIDKGLVKLSFVPFPIDKPSMSAALLAECVAPQKYFSFAEVLFKKQRDWGLSRNPENVLRQYAALSGVGADRAEACLHNDDKARDILEIRQDGITQLGIQGTPSFVIADKNGKQLYSGIMSLAKFEEIIAQKLPQNSKN